MKLFLQALSTLSVAAMIGTYLAYRRCLKPDYAETKTPEALKKEANIYLTILFIALFCVIISAVILRKYL